MSDSFSGSCLCGAVRYEIQGKADRFYFCYCQRCRKATASEHASNIFVMNPDSVNWHCHEGALTRYKIPEAARFEVCFCKQCGSNMPRVAPDNSYALIPAGTLDDMPDVQPQARIFTHSKADWACITDELPEYSHYPE